jgi:hypothetical protein
MPWSLASINPYTMFWNNNDTHEAMQQAWNYCVQTICAYTQSWCNSRQHAWASFTNSNPPYLAHRNQQMCAHRAVFEPRKCHFPFPPHVVAHVIVNNFFDVLEKKGGTMQEGEVAPGLRNKNPWNKRTVCRASRQYSRDLVIRGSVFLK